MSNVYLDTMISALPRDLNDTNVITIELKRKMCYKHGRKEQIRPQKVRKAASYLVHTELFLEKGIILNENFKNSTDEEIIDFNNEDKEEEKECTCETININEEDLMTEKQETLIDDQMTIIIAPGEGQTPLSLIYDENLEEMAFIKVHCGQKRKFKVTLSHSDIIKSEITRYDRRAIRSDYLFTALKKQHAIKIKNNIITCLRKKKTNPGLNLSAGMVLDPDFINNLIQHDDGFRILQSIKNSPAYWQKEKSKVMAMIRQFDIPTFFITLSAGETRWSELIQSLKKIVDNEEMYIEQIQKLPYTEKVRLIQSDPFICDTYFEIRTRELIKTWKCSNGPFGKHEILHFYQRIEFQHRESPHIHMLIWLSNSPKFIPGDAKSMTNVIKFVNTIITCNKKDLIEFNLDVQTHKHTHTCKSRPGKSCRFNIPFFPLPSTMILLQLDEESLNDKTALNNAKKSNKN